LALFLKDFVYTCRIYHDTPYVKKNKLNRLKATGFTDPGLGEKMDQDKSYIKNTSNILILVFLLVLYYLSHVNYLFFHTAAELFSIIIAFNIFIIAVNTYRVAQNSFFMLLGIAFGFVGSFDLLHMLAYQGMDIIGAAGDDAHLKLWISARYLGSMSLLLAVLLHRKKLNLYIIAGFYAFMSAILAASFFVWPLFPASGIADLVLPLFLQISEFIISCILVAALVLIFQTKKVFHKHVFWYIVLSFAAALVSEIFFAFNTGLYGWLDVSGHLLKLVSFYFMYQALVVTSLSEPQKLLFYELAQTKNKSLKINEQLIKEIKNHKQTAKLLQRVNRALKVLSESNRVIAGARNEAELINNICQVIVEVGGYHSAWVGYAEQNRERTVRSFNHGGGPGGNRYSDLVISSGSNPELNSGSTAVTSMVPAGINSWQSQARRKPKSEFTVPLVLDNQILGSINIVAAEPEAFNEVENELLTKLSQNMAYGINMLRSRAEKKKAEEALRESEEKFRLLFHNANDAIFLLSVDESPYRFLEVNDVSCRKFGYDRDEFLERTIEEIVFNKELRAFKEYLAECLEKGHATYELNVTSKEGQRIPIEANGHLFNLKDRRVMLSIARDITERKQAEEQLRFISLHDTLTGLSNRALFEREMSRLENRRQYPVGIIMCDVDGLKLVNDTLGHDAGDTLLVNAAKVIKQCFREGDTVARIGGDEFAVLLTDVDTAAVEVACKRIRDAFAGYNETNPELPLSISVGSAVSGSAFIKMLDLFKEADNNMYREKLHRRQSARSSIVNTLIKALEERDFITGGHAERLQDLVAGLASTIGLKQRLTDLRLLAQFHDIGKVGIPDRILFKQGPLTTEETKEMQRHSEIGYRIAQSAPELLPIAEWILKHHEWWNGKGYPLGLKGEQIPLECRILAIADAYDAMTSDRPYRKAMSFEEAAKELQDSSGAQFDPELVHTFISTMQANCDSM